jgi:hypothetical protein
VIASRRANADQYTGASPQLRLMRIGDTVLYEGREFILRGLDPMSVENRQAELQDPRTGEVVRVPLDDVEER